MSVRPRMRPRFELRFGGSVDGLRQRLEAELEQSKQCVGKVFRANASIWLPDAQRSYWSPFLNLSFEEEADHVRLHGRFSPHPSVWTLFIAIYFALALCGIGAGVYGLVEWSLYGTAWWLLGVPVSMAAIAFVFGASLIGQGLSADEMHELRNLVERACGPAKKARSETAIKNRGLDSLV